MKRLLIAAFLTLSALPAWAAELPVALREIALVKGDVVRLGDLWDNLGPKAEVVIANAPLPGKRVTADARWLAAVAQAHSLSWQPANAFERIVIERQASRVDPKVVEQELREALALEGVPGNFEMDVGNRGALEIVVPGDADQAVAVRDVNWDPRTHRFTATIEVPAGAPDAVRSRINGRVFPTTRIPVLARAVNRGDVIREADIQWVEVREDQVRRDSVVDPAAIIGMEPRFTIRAGLPVRGSDLQRPLLVTRNAPVTIALKTPFMTLTTQGRAVEDGGKGDLIRVTNLTTKRVVEATVTGPGIVSVAGSPRLLAN